MSSKVVSIKRRCDSILITEAALVAFCSLRVADSPHSFSLWRHNTCGGVSVSRRVHGLILLQAPAGCKHTQAECVLWGEKTLIYLFFFLQFHLLPKADKERFAIFTVAAMATTAGRCARGCEHFLLCFTSAVSEF